MRNELVLTVVPLRVKILLLVDVGEQPAAPWCSGLTYCPVKAEIAGSNPVGVASVLTRAYTFFCKCGRGSKELLGMSQKSVKVAVAAVETPL